MLAGEAIIPELVRRVVGRVLRRCDGGEQRLEEVLFETVFQEEQRLARAGDAHEYASMRLLSELRRGLARGGQARRRELLHAAVLRYAHEISGFFAAPVYRFATRVVPPALAALMHGGRPSRALFDVQDRVLMEGEVAALKAATARGTVVLVPTHVSNLDSLLMGYAIFALGLPPFAYGAGLNLFSNRLTGFFMRNLGAFTVDRQKADPLYRDTLKEYMSLLLEHGQHVLFFPGGTRSRVGAVETHLKLGLLGAAISAFGNLQRDRRDRPIFIVPCTLTYPLVLEASSLIEEYLHHEGGAQYLDVGDEFAQPGRWYDFLRGLSQLDVRVHVRLGPPLDVLGHPVDAEGISHGPGGAPLDPAAYLRVGGVPQEDAARDAEYTRTLARRVVDCFRRQSVALPSSLLAFVAFERLRVRHPELDLFRLLRVLGQYSSIPLSDATRDVATALPSLHALASQGALTLAPELRTSSAEQLVSLAAATLSSYHNIPALELRQGLLHVRDPALLFYYRNRLDGYGLLGAPTARALHGIRRRSK